MFICSDRQEERGQAVVEGEDEPEARKAGGAYGSSGPSKPHPAESTSLRSLKKDVVLKNVLQ